jgi:oxygen-dependent protoporphyrinogen oxidase
MASIVERLVDLLPAGALHLGVRVTGLATGAARRWALVTGREGGPGGDAFEADAVVLAIGAPAAAPLLRPIDAAAADALASIPYGSSTTVNLAWKAADLPRPLDGFGFVVPRREKRRLIACSFTSVKFAGRAPDDAVLVRAFTGDEQMPGADAGAVLAAMRAELRDILGIEAAPILSTVAFHPASMPRYEVGHLALAATIASRIESQTGLALAGNALAGVGVPDCIRSGEAAAERILSRAPHLVS